MALRQLRMEADEILRKKSREVKEITPNIITLLDDMVETMRSLNGLGLAAPQVGALRRIVVIEVEGQLIELINPVVVETSGMQCESEACLSLPRRSGKVERPSYVKVRALDRDGKEIFVEGEGLLAVALCHETDHLEGILYTDKVIEMDDDDIEDDAEEDEGDR